MVQRKLTDEELQVVMDARFHVRQLAKFLDCQEYCWRFLTILDDAANYKTSDGKSYVEPKPEIGEGYRKATEADKDRQDIEFWSCEYQKWFVRDMPAVGAFLAGSYHYRVPIDRIPTDDDARERPLVMVRDNDTSKWAARTLIAVSSHPDFPFIAIRDKVHSSWRQCRFPYPGE